MSIFCPRRFALYFVRFQRIGYFLSKICPSSRATLVNQRRTLDKNPPRDIIILLIGAEFVQGSPAGPQHCSPEFVPGRLWKNLHFYIMFTSWDDPFSALELPVHFGDRRSAPTALYSRAPRKGFLRRGAAQSGAARSGAEQRWRRSVDRRGEW